MDAPAVNKNNLPKKPAVGGMPANENNANAKIQLNNGLVLYNPLYASIFSLPVCDEMAAATPNAARLENT